MSQTRPAPVDVAFLHEFNDAYIFISSTTLEAEIEVFLEALNMNKKDMLEPDNEQVFLSLSEKLQLSIDGSVVALSVSDLKKKLLSVSAYEKGQLLFRLYQIRTLIQAQKHTRFGDTFVVSPSWCHRWIDLIGGRVLHADVICLDVDDFQP